MKNNVKRINESQLRTIVAEAVKDELNKVGTKPKGYEDDEEEVKHDSSRFFTPGTRRAPHTTRGWGLSNRSEMYSESKIRKAVNESMKKVLGERVYPRFNSDSPIENELTQIESAYEDICAKAERGDIKLNDKALKMIYDGMYLLGKETDNNNFLK